MVRSVALQEARIIRKMSRVCEWATLPDIGSAANGRPRSAWTHPAREAERPPQADVMGIREG